VPISTIDYQQKQQMEPEQSDPPSQSHLLLLKAQMHAESRCRPSYSLQYVAPEVFAAVNAGEEYITVSAAADIWALGVIAFELLSRSRAFPAGISKEAITSQLLGQQALPWEEGGSGNAELSKLRGLRRSVLRCLRRNPESRMSAAELVEMWEGMFDYAMTANR
jgi:serine/threonine protein kinase